MRCAAKFVAAYDRPFWRDRGQNGLAESEGILGSTWPQSEGVLSCLVPPERSPRSSATDPAIRTREALAELAELFGPDAPSRSRPRRGCGAPTRGRRATSPTGDPATCTAVGPLHGTHEPPFYVCGSDQWVAGYMEGAVRTGRAAAAPALAGRLTRRSG